MYLDKALGVGAEPSYLNQQELMLELKM